MKTFETIRLSLLFVIFGLTGCLTDTTIPEQITSLNVDCETVEVKISDESIEVNGEQSWTAECKGKTYACSYLPESNMACYELKE